MHKHQTETHPQSSCEKGLLSCPGVSVCWAGFRFDIYPEATEASQGTCAGRHHIRVLPWPHHSSQIPPQRGLYTLKATIFATVTQGTAPDLLVWKSAGLQFTDPQDTIYFHTLHGFLRMWLTISLKLGTSKIPPFEILTGLGKPLTTGTIRNKSGYSDNHKV